MIDVAKYVGIPFVDNRLVAPSFAGVDCFGLIRLFYRVEFGIEIPDPHVSAFDVGGTVEAYRSRVAGEWVLIDEPVEWCGVAMAQEVRCPKLVTHFGVLVPGRRVLHSSDGVGSHVSRLAEVAWSIKGFYSWRG